jgi:DNA repair protein RadC
MDTQESGERHERYASAQTELKPREKLASSGAQSLSDSELIAVLLGHGIRGKSIRSIAEEILNVFENHGQKADLEALSGIVGMGTARAACFAAAIEYGRRVHVPADRKILMPRDILPLVAHYADRLQERFVCLSLNGAHEVMAVRVVSVGLVNRAIVHPREVYADPITDRASAIVAAHNHPSGNLEPSQEDRDITIRLRDAGKTLGIDFLDHIIFSSRGYYSFLEHGEL